jgi:hypothetical protein
MAENRDILFGQIALERGLITKAQLDEVLARQEQGDGRQIGMLLIDAGHLQEDELEMVLTVQRERMARTAEHSTAKLSDVLFGRLIVARKLATQGQVNECLREQAKLEQMGMFMRLGEMLAKKGYCSSKQVDELVAYQRAQMKQFEQR